MVNSDKVRGKIAERRLKYIDVARYLNMSTATLDRRLKARRFDSDEIEILRTLLNLSPDEAESIFFAK